MEINGTQIRVYIKLTPDKGDVVAFVTLIINEWIEIKGFRIRRTDFTGRLNNNLWITPPAIKSGYKYSPAFYTTSGGDNLEEREKSRKQLWFRLEDLIFEEYQLKVNEEGGGYEPTEADFDDLIPK